jgi:hypothetical protein
MVREILDFLLEDEEETLKDILDPSEIGWGMQPGDELYLYDQHGNRIRRSRNLAGIRRYVARWPVKQVEIKVIERPRGDTEGGVRIDFTNGYYWVGRFADYHVLKWALRNWRNLYGAKLIVNDQDAGQISYRNPALGYQDPGLRESVPDDEPGQYKELYAPAEQVTLDQMRATEPGFFARSKGNRVWFGRSKYYGPYKGNYLVVRNTRKEHGHFGNMREHTTYEIYQFARTPDEPKGGLRYKGTSHDLQDAKEMIKSQDFRPFRERVADRAAQLLAQRPVAEAEEEEDYKELYTGAEVLRDDGTFRIVKLATGQYFLQTALENVHPRSVQISPNDAKYLIGTSAAEYKLSALMDFGCGVFDGPEETE